MAPPRELTDEQRNFEAVFLASQDVLIDYGFEIDRRDRRRGEVTAKPMLGSHLLEFWRRDATTSFDIAEGALQKIYIVATVKIQRMSPTSDQFMPAVIVERLRSSTPERVPHKARLMAASAPDTGDSGPTVVDGAPNFVRLGRDKDLEIQIAADITSASVLRLARMSYVR